MFFHFKWFCANFMQMKKVTAFLTITFFEVRATGFVARLRDCDPPAKAGCSEPAETRGYCRVPGSSFSISRLSLLFLLGRLRTYLEKIQHAPISSHWLYQYTLYDWNYVFSIFPGQALRCDQYKICPMQLNAECRNNTFIKIKTA